MKCNLRELCPVGTRLGDLDPPCLIENKKTGLKKMA